MPFQENYFRYENFEQKNCLPQPDSQDAGDGYHFKTIIIFCAVISKSTSYIIFIGISFQNFRHIKATENIKLNFKMNGHFKTKHIKKKKQDIIHPGTFVGELCPVSLIFSFELSHPALRCKTGCPHPATVSFLFSPKGNGRSYQNGSHISYRILSFRKERHIKFYHFGEYCGLSFLFRPMRIPRLGGTLHKATQAACQNY